MVSLIHPEHIKQIESNWKTKLFNDFIHEKPINPEIYLEDNFVRIIKATTKDTKADFEKFYSEFSQRKPSEDSPWLHDNFFIFILIVGIVKYNIAREWLEKVFELRESRNKEITQINTTFKNLINKNYSSKDNLFEIVFVFQELINIPISPSDEIDDLYNKLSSDFSLLNIRDDFLKIIRLRVVDLIVLQKELPNTVEITVLKDFKNTFLKRIDFISKAIYAVLVIGLVVGIYVYQSKNKTNQELVNTINTISGLLGVGLLILIKQLSKWVRLLILVILGYNKIYNNDNTPR
ncbi:hypothetical protein EYV94_27505 [Puteibacter caeruleilacunae]|nr:hypothetical protein EYV94_27505 [Puteibacter caeruleilacunae]